MQKRRQMTYGKAAARGPSSKSFASGFDAFQPPSDSSPKTPSKLKRPANLSHPSPQQSPIQSTKTEDPFSFQASDNEDEVSRSPVRPKPKKDIHSLGRAEKAVKASTRAVATVRLPSSSLEHTLQPPSRNRLKTPEDLMQDIQSASHAIQDPAGRKRKRDTSIQDKQGIKPFGNGTRTDTADAHVVKRNATRKPAPNRDPVSLEAKYAPSTSSKSATAIAEQPKNVPAPAVSMQQKIKKVMDRSKMAVEPHLASTGLHWDEEGEPMSGKTTQSNAKSAPSTPRAHKIPGDAHSPLDNRASTTPRQARMWKMLLTTDQGSMPAKKLQSLSLGSDDEQSDGLNASNAKHFPRRKLIDSLRQATEMEGVLEGDYDETLQGSDDEQEQPEDLFRLDSDMPSIPPNSSQVGRDQPSAFTLGGPRITYASQRSYLEEPIDGLEALLAAPLDSPFSMPMHGNNTQATTFRDEDDEGLVNDSVKSLHELRALGGNTRFQDDMNNLKDELKAQGKSAVSRKRTALLDLLDKLRDSQFKGRLVQEGLDREILAACCFESDQICATLTAALISTLFKEPSDASSAMSVFDLGLLEHISPLFSQANDIVIIVKDRKFNMSRMAQAGFADFKQSFCSAQAMESDKLSPKDVAMKAAEVLIRRLREGGNASTLLTAPALDAALSSLNETQHRGSIALSLLESATVAPACSANDKLWNATRLEQIGTQVEAACAMEQLPEFKSLLLRFILNLSNGKDSRSDAFARSPFLRKVTQSIIDGLKTLKSPDGGSSDSASFDALVLALGVMINLSEMSRKVLDNLAGCIEAEMIHSLTWTFLEGRRLASEAESLEQSQANVAYGYLAVFLSIMCGQEQLRHEIRKKLPLRSLTSLINAMEEFVQHHQAADSKEQANDIWVSFTNRLRAVMTMLKSCD